MALEFQVTYYMVGDSVMINVNQTIFERTILQSYIVGYIIVI